MPSRLAMHGARGGRRALAAALLLSTLPLAARAQPPALPASSAAEAPPLLPAATVQALAEELSGTAAKRTVQALTLEHRMRGSRGFRAAAERIAAEAKRAGLTAVEILSFPADGTIFYGTQRSRPAWDADFAELWEQRPVDGSSGSGSGSDWADATRIASWETRPITLAEDSATGEAAGRLVDVGAGTAEAEYEGKDVRGQLVLASAQPDAVEELAVERFGAAGIVSYAQNQPTAWSGEDENLVRWGHLQSFPRVPSFAFMVSAKQARAWQRRLAAGETVRLRASVRAGRHPGSYDVVTAVLPGGDAALRGQEIVLSCHLDHERPGANDNASGCATILEVGRGLAALVRAGRLAPPRRTIRFVWPAEVEGTLALLNARPDLAARARAVIHMDMVGGDPAATGAVFHVTRTPKSLPTFVNDVGEAFARFVNAQSDAYAATGQAAFPLADPEGSKAALQAAIVDFTPGSDHEVWSEGSWRVPAIYMNDWPDRTIHTDADALANIDATKLLRAAFLGAASAYYLAGLDGAGAPALWEVIRRHSLERTAEALARCVRLQRLQALAPGTGEAANLLDFHFRSERRIVDSLAGFAPLAGDTGTAAAAFESDLEKLARAAAGEASASSGSPAASQAADAASPDAALVYRRLPAPKGTMVAFGYGFLADHLKRQGIPPPALLAREGLWGDGALYAYEALNLIDGERTVRRVRDDLAAIYGPLPLAEVAQFLATLERIGVLARR